MNVSIWPTVVLRETKASLYRRVQQRAGRLRRACTGGLGHEGGPTVAIGHRAIIHGCEIEDDCLIGMGAIVMDNARIGAGSVVGPGRSCWRTLWCRQTPSSWARLRKLSGSQRVPHEVDRRLVAHLRSACTKHRSGEPRHPLGLLQPTSWRSASRRGQAARLRGLGEAPVLQRIVATNLHVLIDEQSLRAVEHGIDVHDLLSDIAAPMLIFRPSTTVFSTAPGSPVRNVQRSRFASYLPA